MQAYCILTPQKLDFPGKQVYLTTLSTPAPSHSAPSVTIREITMFQKNEIQMKKILRGMAMMGGLILCGYTPFEKSIGNTDCYEEAVSLSPLPSGQWVISSAYNCSGHAEGWQGGLLFLTERGDSIAYLKNQPFNGIMKPCGDGNLIFGGGNHAGFVYDTAFLFKVTPGGDMLWKRTLFDSLFNHMITAIEPVADGFLIMGIYTPTPAPGPRDSYIARLDTSGKMIWIYREENDGNEQFHAAKPFPDGSVIAFGWVEPKTTANDADYFLVKLNGQGQLLWSKTYGGTENNFGYGLDITAEGNIFLNGYSSGMDAIKLDSAGNVIWTKRLADACGGRYFKVKAFPSAIVFLGTAKNEDGKCQSVLIQTDANGNIRWQKYFDAVLRDFHTKDAQHFVLAGYHSYPSRLYVTTFDIAESFPAEIKPDILMDTLLSTYTPSRITREKGVHVFPVPAKHSVILDMKNMEAESYSLKLQDASGKLCRWIENIHTSTIVLHREDLSPGIYYYHISGKQTLLTGKIIFQ
ncbi:MAG: hypothetical protein KatS3mg031_2720 [Chitinophagales bacterium]|nr:MAG: hypothetical protein KatS3mg031_2720 [Chitinophagales bacterium]